MNLKKLNLGLVALLLGFGLVITQSAFTPKADPRNHQYGQLQDGTWVEIDDSKYECVESESYCKGTFSYADPLPNATPDISMEGEEAVYQLRTP